MKLHEVDNQEEEQQQLLFKVTLPFQELIQSGSCFWLAKL